MLAFKRLRLKLLIIVVFLPSRFSWVLIYKTQNNLDYIQIEIVKVNPQIDSNIVLPTVYALSKTIPLRLFISILVIYLLPE